ncbi:tape measure protein [Daeguia caeni]|uniref:Tape measure protein n=1 Tax=Daeguia caeni TaxID=439612 RepID=A0ABV9H3I4_9HYPH
MATDLEKLVVQLSADLKSFERSMARANGITNSQFNAIEKRARQMNKNLDAIFARSFSGLVAPLGGIGAALGTREILRYADAWTSAKNSLAVAGVVGAQQANVLERLYQSAQANATPISALADLYGRAAQASDNLGASQADMLKFSDGVAVALRVAGTSASQASGALTQLGQLLGQARVQAEEFNSINEGARPILIAVANGLDEAGGSVSKLKQLVTDGKVSGQQFFQAFLRGLPTIQSMAANATQTIEQGITKVNNAFTKYIGETDESLGASQRLVQGLNSLADNFDHTADIVLKVAGIIAGALVGRSIFGMIRSLGLASSAVWSFVSALRTASSMSGLVTAFGGLGAAAGPIGTILGGTVVSALALYSLNASEASQKSKKFEGELEALGLLAPRVAEGIDTAAKSIKDLTDAKNAQKLRSIADELDRIRTGGNFGNAGDELSAIQARARSSVFDLFSDDSADSKARTEIVELAHLLQGMQVTTEEVRKRMDAIRSTPISDAVKDMADELDRTAQKIAALQAQSLSLGVMPGMDEAKQQLDTVINDLDRLEKREIITAEQRKNLEDALKKLRDTGEGAEEARAALAAIGGVSFSTALVGLDGLINKVAVLYSQAAQAKALLSGISWSTVIEGRAERSSKDPYIQAREAGNAYLKEAQRRNTLTKEQLALETEIARIKKDAEKTGAILTEKQLREQAQANLAADARRSASSKASGRQHKTPDQKLDREISDVVHRTAALVAETEAMRQLNPLVNDYGYAVEKARTEQDLLTAAQRAGVAITPELRAQISQTAEQWAVATTEANKLAEAHDKIRQSAEEWRDAQKDALRGIVDDLIAGKSAAEAFAGALDKIINKLMDMAFDNIFSGLFRGGGGILGLLGFKDGGVIQAASGGYISGPGTSRSDSIPARLSNGEYVVNAAATKKFRPLLDAINNNKIQKMADGGVATLRAPSLPNLSYARPLQSTGRIAVDVGVSVDNNGNLQSYVKNIAQQTSQNAIRSYDKAGAARFARDSKQAQRRGLL